MTGDHDVSGAVSSVLLVSHDNCSQLPKGHLQEVAYPKDRLLQLSRLHLTFRLLVVFVVKLGRFWLFQGVICQSLDNANHFCDGQDNQLLGIICEHNRTCAQNDAGKDSCHELQGGLFRFLLLNADPSIRNEQVTSFFLAI